MAGGSGERFWPLSRKNRPKQLLPLGNSENSMIAEAVERISPLISPENIFIITGEHLTAPIRDELKYIPAENVIPEPAKRNTAPALALAASYIVAKYGDTENISTAILTADHIMTPQEGFLDTVKTALEFVENDDSIATIGIPPIRPETGYGYLHLGDSQKENSPKVFSLNSFKEKPNLETAEKYIEDGNYLWNSGMFFWRMDTFVGQMRKHLPKVGEQILLMSKEIAEHKLYNVANIKLETITDTFEAFPDISIDFGLMEKADKIVAVEAVFKWDDIGDLCSVERTKSADVNGNISVGKTYSLDSKNTIFLNNTDKKVLAGIGLEDLVIAVTDDAVLVSKKSDVQNVKKIVKMLKENGEDCL
jgi:mannose-1-phosphate guanylyltransferase